MNKLNTLALKVQMKLADVAATKLTKKANGDETLIIKIMLMVIAVVLILLFRDQLKNIIISLLANLNTKIDGMYK